MILKWRRATIRSNPMLPSRYGIQTFIRYEALGIRTAARSSRNLHASNSDFKFVQSGIFTRPFRKLDVNTCQLSKSKRGGLLEPAFQFLNPADYVGLYDAPSSTADVRAQSTRPSLRCDSTRLKTTTHSPKMRSVEVKGYEPPTRRSDRQRKRGRRSIGLTSDGTTKSGPRFPLSRSAPSNTEKVSALTCKSVQLFIRIPGSTISAINTVASRAHGRLSRHLRL